MIPRRLAPAFALAAFGVGCGPSDPPVAPRCETVSSTAQNASAQGRWLLGLASRYPADTALAGRADALRRSQRARRAAAWQAVARTFAPVPVAQQGAPAGSTMPRFRTWYDREDVSRVFQRLYRALSPADRTAARRFSDTELDAAFGWNVDFVNTLPEWDAQRLARFVASFETPAALASVQGVNRIAISPDVARHVIQSYPEVVRCINGPGVPVFVDTAPSTQRVAREPIALSHCGAMAYGPYFVATGGSLVARLEGAAGAVLRVSDASAAAGEVRCTASDATGCTVRGPGTFRVHVDAREAGAQGVLDVRYESTEAPATACLDGAFSPAAATVAMEWRRAQVLGPLPTYDTSAAGIARRFGAGGDETWGAGDGHAEPSDTQIYTQRLESGNTFRLAAMHIRTREVDQWLNITLWWSPEPDGDFGADRPAEVRALGAPWSNYKMCVAMDYNEADPDPTGGFSADAPSLAAALRAVYEGHGGPSWCSNPYIDAGPRLARSNCVGCHQHAMSGLRPAEVQENPDRFPGRGRARLRNNLPADGFWGLDAGDRLGAVLVETVDFYRDAP